MSSAKTSDSCLQMGKISLLSTREISLIFLGFCTLAYTSILLVIPRNLNLPVSTRLMLMKSFFLYMADLTCISSTLSRKLNYADKSTWLNRILTADSIDWWYHLLSSQLKIACHVLLERKQYFLWERKVQIIISKRKQNVRKHHRKYSYSSTGLHI